MIVDRLNNSSRFLTVKTTYSLYDYAKLYIDEIFRLHGFPYEALYGHRCRSPAGWFEVGEATLIGLD